MIPLRTSPSILIGRTVTSRFVIGRAAVVNVVSDRTVCHDFSQSYKICSKPIIAVRLLQGDSAFTDEVQNGTQTFSIPGSFETEFE